MSFISPVSTKTTSSSSDSSATGTDSLGKDDFLQLMVTKLQYQDPLNPMEDEDFIAQLAQFSSLEQMTNIADGIETSNEWDFLQMQSLNNVLASNLIGREVEADFSGVYLDESNQPKISFTLPQDAKDIKFEVRDSSGVLVAKFGAEDLEVGATFDHLGRQGQSWQPGRRRVLHDHGHGHQRRRHERHAHPRRDRHREHGYVPRRIGLCHDRRDRDRAGRHQVGRDADSG